MAHNLIPIEQARAMAPAKMRERMAAGTALSNRFADNVADAFPRLSIKGKVFRIKMDGREMIARDQHGHALAFLDVVLINASAQLAKTFYTKGFTDGDQNPPDCWSLDSVRPDVSVLKKVNPTCPDCPMNAFGSRITPDGKAAKACADSRRIAIAMPHELAGTDAIGSFLLRVPQGSLKNMRNYTMDTLARNGYEPGGCVTRLSFDPTVAFPKLQFEFVAPVTDVEYDRVIELATSPFVASMLKAPDFDNVASAANAAQPATAGQRQQAPVLTPEDEDDEVVTTQHAARQQAPVFTAGEMAEQQQAQADHAVATGGFVPVQGKAEQEVWTDLGDEELNEATGEIRPKAYAAPDMGLDPDVIVTSDGRFFNRATKKFVPTQFRADVPAAAVDATKAAGAAVQQAAAAVAAKPKRTRAKAQAELQQQPASESENPAPKANGPTEGMVVAASPKLEALLAGMTPKK